MVNNMRPRDNIYGMNPLNSRNVPNMTNCVPQEMVIENVRLAAAYVPYQFMCEIFSPFEALAKGTAFPELYSPYDRKDTRNKANRLSENS